ncbi:helix-hairpin-helix domain-containing protein [Plantactinospora sp. GCM10030261]|uniref:helix-hairpin-helix domain-containing protein n=1 Tax=Plantactinospora sp. GCM10030261 TaxID=3273420 RepID=UPI0036244AA1
MTDDEISVQRRLGRLFDDRAPSAGPPEWPGTESAARGLPRSSPDDVTVSATMPDPSADLSPADQVDPVSGGRLPMDTGRLDRLGGAFDPGRRGVRALAVVALVVAVGAALWAWRARPATEQVGSVGTVTTSAAPANSAAGAEDRPAADGGTPVAEVVVTVAGKVHRPGLVRLPAGARLADAIEAAGGALPGVDVAMLNPARRLTDGELIAVEVTPPPGAVGQPAAGAAPPGAVPGGSGGPINLNTATLADLDGLPGVGPVLAQRILDHRQRHGPFKAVSDLRQVDGIGEARYEDLKDMVTV